MARYAVVVLAVLLGCNRQPSPTPGNGASTVAPSSKHQSDSLAEKASGTAAAPGPDLVSAKESRFADWPQPAVALVLTGQLIGYLEPCGCTGLENQKGGLARRHTLIKELGEERGWPVVPLDVGSQVKRFGKQQEVKFAHIVQGLRTMACSAIALGEGD